MEGVQNVVLLYRKRQITKGSLDERGKFEAFYPLVDELAPFILLKPKFFFSKKLETSIYHVRIIKNISIL